ncbi:toprim domain-containing protein [Marinifilum sp. D737]|uniref:toprim domain-containing protein n=1 Tax=Marinifilum sp. D737 TaxID=2969628 RepID=UPI002273F68A|nr:toprim domain-containing protein [Marinifilum sp. D737]MCY1633912.1 toprim domain-containing protein [Marinifilum sp. D737]
MKEKINCANAKRLPITEFLEKLGHKPVKTKGNDIWYLSPFRLKENHPSFKVNKVMNVWYDFGEGTGGTIIDLGIKLNNCSISEFLQNLNSFNFSFQQPEIDTITTNTSISAVKIQKIKPITSSKLLHYLKERYISRQTANIFCKEIEYSINGKLYYALGFPNSNGGYELRNKHFKGCCAPKSISLIENNNNTICVFEGFFDAMSHYEIIQGTGFRSDVLVLNSIALLSKALDTINRYEKIFLYLDNNRAGNTATNKLKEHFKNKVEDMRYSYKKFEDLNKFLVANGRCNPSKSVYRSSSRKPKL